MLLNHIGIVNKSREDAVGFYRDFLGFSLSRETIIPAELSGQLFLISRDIAMLVFEREWIKIEVFIAPEFVPASPDIAHTGFLLTDFAEVIEKAAKTGVKIIKGSTTEKTVYFIRDFSGNLLEVKQK